MEISSVLSFINGGIVSDKRDLLALYLSGTYCHKSGTRPPSSVTPWQLTIYRSLSLIFWWHKLFYNLILVFDFKITFIVNSFAVKYILEIILKETVTKSKKLLKIYIPKSTQALQSQISYTVTNFWGVWDNVMN